MRGIYTGRKETYTNHPPGVVAAKRKKKKIRRKSGTLSR